MSLCIFFERGRALRGFADSSTFFLEVSNFLGNVPTLDSRLEFKMRCSLSRRSRIRALRKMVWHQTERDIYGKGPPGRQRQVDSVLWLSVVGCHFARPTIVVMSCILSEGKSAGEYRRTGFPRLQAHTE